MALDLVTESPVVDAPTSAPASEPELSLADHEAAFGPNGTGQPAKAEPVEDDDEGETRARDEAGRFQKHRAASQKATADDVAEINALTKELRTKEAELLKVKPDAKAGSPRLLALKRQIRAIEADLADLQPKASNETPATRPQTPVVAAAGEFTEPEPTFEQFSAEADPYAAYMRALARYDRKKEAFDAAQSEAQTQRETNRREAVEKWNQRVTAFAAQTPDFHAVTREFFDRELPNVLNAAIGLDDNGPQYVYYLAQHPDLADELFLQTATLPMTDASVAVVQRRLKQHAKAATTGSAAVQTPSYSPPRPPNPVRTGPIRTTGDDLPGDESSLAEHERAFHEKRRR